MDLKEKWNKICDYFEKFKNESEDRIQILWEKLFSEVFGYSSLDNEIDSHRSIKLGATERLIPDIIIKNEDKDLFMVELKREVLNVDETRRKQLYSYLKQDHNDLGILICNQICIIDYNYNISDDAQKFCLIDFVKNNPQGIKFIEVFQKENFSKEKAVNFINECIGISSKLVEIRKQLNSELIINLLREYLQKKFSNSEIETVLKEYEIKISKKQQNFLSLCKAENLNELKNKESLVCEKTDYEKLMRDIRSVGMETFVKYFQYYNNPNYETSDIKRLFRQYENFNENSMASKASTGKGIVRRGNAKAALEIIVKAHNIDFSIREKAQEFLKNL